MTMIRPWSTASYNYYGYYSHAPDALQTCAVARRRRARLQIADVVLQRSARGPRRGGVELRAARLRGRRGLGAVRPLRRGVGEAAGSVPGVGGHRARAVEGVNGDTPNQAPGSRADVKLRVSLGSRARRRLSKHLAHTLREPHGSNGRQHNAHRHDARHRRAKRFISSKAVYESARLISSKAPGEAVFFRPTHLLQPGGANNKKRDQNKLVRRFWHRQRFECGRGPCRPSTKK